MHVKSLLALSFAATVLCAQGPRNWSDSEIRSMVTDSPWAHNAVVRLPQESSDSAVSDGIPAVPQILVRWESALPVCEACAQGGLDPYLFSCVSKLLYLSGLSEKFEGLAKHFYILSMSNYPKPVSLLQGPQPPEHSAAANAALAQLAKRIGEATFIKCRGGQLVRPADLVALPAGHALLLMVFFPRTADLTVGDGEVSFESTDGAMKITSTFDLKKMIYNGKLEL